MRLSTASCLIVVAALFNGAGAAKAESDIFTLAGTFWRLDHADGMVDDTPNIVAHISLVRINVMTPNGIERQAFSSVGQIHFRSHDASGQYAFSFVDGSLKVQSSSLSGDPHNGGSALATVEAQLSKIAGFAVKADVLEFLDDRSHPVLTLSRITTGLESREWFVDQYFDGAQLVTPIWDTEVTFINGSIVGDLGNGLHPVGAYSLSEARLKVLFLLALGSGPRCTGECASRSSGIFHALGGERIVEPDGQRMILRDDHGTVQVVLRPYDR